MNNEYPPLPSSEELAAEVNSMPRKIRLRNYLEPMSAMRAKGYSYAEIAEWMTEKLESEVTRSQVFYILNAPLAQQDAEEMEEETESDQP